MFSKSYIIVASLFAFVAIVALGTVVYATHSWGSYHWARTSNPFTLKLGDNVSSAWDAYLAGASSDWSQSSVLNTTIVAGNTTPRKCRATVGRVEVCNATYGNNGWLGIASIWASGSHITQGTAKMNDTYFNTPTYNTPAWRRLVMCQEVAHTFGLDHQDENFSNSNLGTCMDYTNDPDGPPSNEHPNSHDYSMLETIYAHLDSSTTVGQALPRGNGNSKAPIDFENSAEWGKAIKHSGDGKASLYLRDLGNNDKVFTFVLWAK
ncbi:MAG: hypothetical protein G01um101420_824 [Parcubacteria group bacterium Gr01-1014_20]|nr:MAG: hypothetical protein G01um101420_824 [Parcubacteria group bacterium Gr01-1014_20]